MDEQLCPEQRAKLLLNELSLDEKMAQINCVFPLNEKYTDLEWISSQTPYGIGEVSTLELRRIKTLKEAAAWQRRVQGIVMSNSPHHIPAIFHMEGLCGSMVQEGISLPAGISRGAGWDPELEEELADAVGKQEAACGIGHVLAPVLDISRDSRMGRQGESYGEDPLLAAALGCAYVRGIQRTQAGGRHPECAAKHFLAFHNSQGGIHGTHSDTPSRLLREIYAKPFQAAIKNGLKGIMPCYCSLDGEPASLSKTLLTDLLRNEMGFEGLCVSDYGGISNAYTIDRVGETLGEAGLMALSAGMDVEMPSASGFGKELKCMFEDGRADAALLDIAVLRVLTAKFRMGLFEHPLALEGDELAAYFTGPENRELSLKAARQSFVLLKNKGTLPISKGIRKIALIGSHSGSPRKYFGGYTFLSMAESTLAAANSIAGVEGENKTEGAVYIPGTAVQLDEGKEFDDILKRQKPGCRSILEELKMRLSDIEVVSACGYPVAGCDESGFDEALKICKDADLIILTLGGKYGTSSISTMGEGVDSSDINLPPCQDSFIKKAAGLGKPLVGLHFDGRPISSDTADKYLDAILECFSPAECTAQAAVDVLLGEYNPGGKLPVCVARSAGQIPVYYNHPNGSCWHQAESIGFPDYLDMSHMPRYPFGYGLSYTTFAYSNLRVSSACVSPKDQLKVEIDVRNTGSMDGDEVVQLYISDDHASMTRPVKELAGFKRVHIPAGKKVTVRFIIDPSQFAFIDRNMRWKVEKGSFTIMAGSSSEDIRSEASFNITHDLWIEAKDRSMYAKAEVYI